MIVLYKVKPIIALTMPVSNYCTDYASVMLPVKMTEWRKQFRMTSIFDGTSFVIYVKNFLFLFFIFFVCFFACGSFTFGFLFLVLFKCFCFYCRFPFRLEKCVLFVLNLQCHRVSLKVSKALGEGVLYLFFLLVWTSLFLRSVCSPVRVACVRKKNKQTNKQTKKK